MSEVTNHFRFHIHSDLVNKALEWCEVEGIRCEQGEHDELVYSFAVDGPVKEGDFKAIADLLMNAILIKYIKVQSESEAAIETAIRNNLFGGRG